VSGAVASGTPHEPQHEGTPLSAPWRVTPAHVRALALGVLLVAVGVVLRRPDALVLGAPLLVVALWSSARRPTTAPRGPRPHHPAGPA
jgi:hypothetical protein